MQSGVASPYIFNTLYIVILFFFYYTRSGYWMLQLFFNSPHPCQVHIAIIAICRFPLISASALPYIQSMQQREMQLASTGLDTIPGTVYWQPSRLITCNAHVHIKPLQSDKNAFVIGERCWTLHWAPLLIICKGRPPSMPHNLITCCSLTQVLFLICNQPR